MDLDEAYVVFALQCHECSRNVDTSNYMGFANSAYLIVMDLQGKIVSVQMHNETESVCGWFYFFGYSTIPLSVAAALVSRRHIIAAVIQQLRNAPPG